MWLLGKLQVNSTFGNINLPAEFIFIYNNVLFSLLQLLIRTSRDFKRGTHSMKASYVLLFFALFLTISLWKVARSWAPNENVFLKFSSNSPPYSRPRCSVGLTRPHRAPSCVAMIVAARGVLYMRASSPKLPLLSYFPTHTLTPPFCTRMSYTPLERRRARERSQCETDKKSFSHTATLRNPSLTSLWRRSCLHRLLGLWCAPEVWPTPRTCRPKPQRTAPESEDNVLHFFLHVFAIRNIHIRVID